MSKIRKVVFDIETANIFSDVGTSNDSTKLDISIVGAYDSTTDSYATYTVQELPKLWAIIERADLLIGFNSDHFDIPLLNKYYPGDLTAIKSLDLLAEIKKSLGRRLRLDTIAEATLGVNKSGHGLEAVQWWKEGKEDLVRKYCEDDVRITKEVYDYARKHKELKYKDFGDIKTIKLNTKEWETVDTSVALTHTMPF
ncbi:MAG: ribonuclease H-like domain-containing protein [Candidatus Pacebacteria bacterium]|nr:ribonuclease H-like domain-containing protein [Candidatus Paceibacterota bacterium]